MSDLIKDQMLAQGPCLSTDLTQSLIENFGLADAAARKRVSRGCTDLKRLGHLPFPRKARFLYLQKQYGSPEYWHALEAAILGGGTAYGPALAALIQRDGIVPKTHFAVVSGAPVRQKKHLSAETILDRFIKANIVSEIDVPGVGACVVLSRMINRTAPDVASLRARLVTEAVLLKAVKMWLRNLGLVSYDKIATRDEDGRLPQVGTFAWDLTGPSYLIPMVEWSDQGKKNPGFVACDVLLGRPITASGISAFVQKSTTLGGLKRVGRCLQIFVADEYTPEAFAKAKTVGLVPATPETLFGKEVAEGLARLTEVLSDAARLSQRPEVFNELFERLGKIEGAATNLRGALFEFLVAQLVRHRYSCTVTNGKILQGADGEKAEVDVLAVVANRSIHFIECKGYQPSGIVDDAEVEKWLTKHIPFVRKEALQHPDWKSLDLHFEFWTTGKLSPEATSRIDAAKKRTSKYKIEYRDAAAVRLYAEEVKDRALILTLKQHFLEHPTTTAESDVDKRKEKEARAIQRRAARAPAEL
jgi:hypothetical protein